MATRRDFLRMAGVAALATPCDVTAFAGAGPDPFKVPLTVPRVLEPVRRGSNTDYYDITIRRARAAILPGRKTPVWTYDGKFPGPTIKARSGRRVVVRHHNRLGMPVTVHLHGAKVPVSSDGHPAHLIRPGGAKRFRYPNDQIAATLWYHDHTHRHTSHNIYIGLTGLYLIADDFEDGLNLPSGKYDIPLIIQNRNFKRDGSFDFRRSHHSVGGKVILVNGRPAPYLEVANRKYRFRILNASNSRGYHLALDTGRPLVQIGGDQGLLPAPYAASSIPLWPAERAEVVVDFSAYPVGSKIVLEHRNPLDPAKRRAIMRFEVTHAKADPSSLPPVLRPIAPIAAEARRERTFDLSLRDGVWVINGRGFDMNRVDLRPHLGSTEIWRFRNLSNRTHPMHVHLVKFQVIERNGVPPGPGEAGWKDTVRVGPAEMVRVAARFEGYPGRYVYHCHNLAHADHNMMGQMRVVER